MTQRPDSPVAHALCAVRALTAHGSARRYELTPVSMVPEGGLRLAQVVRICNEPLVYANLFARVLSNRPYALDDAQRFFTWSNEGWREGTHFVYAIVDEDGGIVGAIDIKSADLLSAEIGYWLSAEHSGVMTSAVEAIAELATSARFIELHALVRPDNPRSASVLDRAGFEYTNDLEREGRDYRRYARKLRRG